MSLGSNGTGPSLGEGFGFQSNSGMSGFQPATGAANWAFQASSSQQEGEDYLDDEERERVERVIAENEERKRALFTKQEQEDTLRRDRKAKGREELTKWNQQKKKEVDLRK